MSESSANLFPNGEDETRRTEETDLSTNEDFLRALFCGPSDGARPVVVSFGGHPGQVPGSAWFGHPWSNGNPAGVAEANTYFSLASFKPDEAGRYRRRKAQYVALHAVMLDDLGGKVPLERLALQPTWLLETSPGNFQAGYAFQEPLLDGLLADRLMNAIVTAGLCDPGANGPRARLGRLPVGSNGKHQPPFRCRMRCWEPERRYSVDDLIAGLQLDLAAPAGPTRRESRPSTGHPEDGDAVLLPGPEENPVIVALRDRGVYKAPLGEGKHDLTCPWVEEHTGGVDHGTAYFEPDDNRPIGGFKCQHGHCSGRHVRDLLAFLGIQPCEARMKPTIRTVAGEIHRVVDAAERELAQARTFYQRGGLIVTVNTDPGLGKPVFRRSPSPPLCVPSQV